MKIEIKVPSMGESISEAIVANIIKSSGSQVAMDDEILELETDKVNQVLYAPQSGVLNLNINPHDKVKIGQILGYVDTDATAEKKPTATPDTEAKAEKEPRPTPNIDAKAEKEPTPTPKPATATATTMEQKTTPTKAKESTESARYGKEEFIRDLQQASAAVSPPKPSTPKISVDNRESRRKMSTIRKVIASRLVEVKNTTAMLTTFNEVDMSQIITLREKCKDAFTQKFGVKLGFMSFFVKACVSALQQFPDVNSYIDGDEIVHREYYDIGIAVSTDRGLIVPVLRSCNNLSYADIEKAIEQFAKKAREASISADDLQGGSFTITNGGVYGSMLSTPILNPNQSAILGMHKIMNRAVVVEDQIVIRPIMYLALSYDHRIIDGKEAVSFLVNIKNALEFPDSMLLAL